MQKAFLIILVSIFFFSFFGVAQVSAQGMVQCDLTGENACTFCDLFVTFDVWIDGLLLNILPILAGLMIAIGGVYYLISRGEPEKLASAKKIFSSVAIGLLIAYSAWLIVNTFFMVVGISGWNGFDGGWWQINCPTTQSSVPVGSNNCLSCTASSGVECTEAICRGLGDCNFVESTPGQGFCLPN